MNSYVAPLRDIRFALFDVIGAETLYQKLGIANAQREIMDAVLDEAAKFTQGVLAPLSSVGDEIGCVHDKTTGAVTTPPGFKAAYAQFVEAGWNGLTAPEAMGGQDMPESLGAAAAAVGHLNSAPDVDGAIRTRSQGLRSMMSSPSLIRPEPAVTRYASSCSRCLWPRVLRWPGP